MHFQGRQLSKLLCLPSEKGSTLKKKRSKFFPFRVDPFADGNWYAESKSVVFSVQNRGKSTESTLSDQGTYQQ